jgi:hypothetical protein
LKTENSRRVAESRLVCVGLYASWLSGALQEAKDKSGIIAWVTVTHIFIPPNILPTVIAQSNRAHIWIGPDAE